MTGPRTVRAPRGTTLTCKSWLTEAPYRMIQNQSRPDVAERPQDLVVYAGADRRRATGNVSTPSSNRLRIWRTMRPCWFNLASQWQFLRVIQMPHAS